MQPRMQPPPAAVRRDPEIVLRLLGSVLSNVIRAHTVTSAGQNCRADIGDTTTCAFVQNGVFMLVSGDSDHQPARPPGGGGRPTGRRRHWRRGVAAAAVAGAVITCAATPTMAVTVSPSGRPSSATDQHILRGVSALSPTDAWTVGLATN